MADLQGGDVTNFTEGRLDGDDAEVKRMLAAALQIARNHCGWHVSPVKTETMTIDGPDSSILFLPTMKVVALTSITEDGSAVDPTNIAISAGGGPLLRKRVTLRKKDRTWWTDQFSGLEIVMNHGFTEAEAVDWREGILSMVDQMSTLPVKASTGASTFGQTTLRVDDVQLGFGNPYTAMAEEVLFSAGSILCGYQLPPLEFM
jgi:hypothetical protein